MGGACSMNRRLRNACADRKPEGKRTCEKSDCRQLILTSELKISDLSGFHLAVNGVPW